MTTTEEEILKAAEEEFLNVGYDACSTAAIAGRVGVTHAMVNYYYRTKEKLFLRILDTHVEELLASLKPLMTASGPFVRVVVDAALALFDTMERNRRLVLLIGDTARRHPEFLMRYEETFRTFCHGTMERHASRLRRYIGEGTVPPCTMDDVYADVLTLAATPFLTLPLLQNIGAYTPEQVDDYLRARREEMVVLLTKRYTV